MARGIWVGLSANGLDGDKAGEWKYFWSNLPAHMPLEVMVEYTHLRHWIEQYHEEAKGELGWDQYQGWRWDGFHRHAVTVMLSYSFLVWLEWQQRQAQRRRGPPRGAFSPRPDRRRLSLPAVHRYIIEWLLFEAIQELIRPGYINQYRPNVTLTK